MLELGIPPICATAAAAVARGRGKYAHSKTVIASLMKRSNPNSTTWTAQADKKLVTAVKKFNRGNKEVKVPVSDPRGRNMYEFALNIYWKLHNKKSNAGVLVKRYEKYHLANTNHIVRNNIQACPNSMDFRWLLAARGGQLLTVNQLTHSHIIRENIDFVTNRNDMCPWCSENVREDTAHIVLNCDRFIQFRGPLQSVLKDMVWELATQLDTGATAVLKNQSSFQDQQQYPRPEATEDILFHVAIGGTWIDDKVFQLQQNGIQVSVFWVMRCKNFLSRAPGVPSHYIAVQKVLSNIYQHRNLLLDQHFTVQEQSKRTCWLFRFYHSEPTPIGRARTTDDEDDS